MFGIPKLRHTCRITRIIMKVKTPLRCYVISRSIIRPISYHALKSKLFFRDVLYHCVEQNLMLTHEMKQIFCVIGHANHCQNFFARKRTKKETPYNAKNLTSELCNIRCNTSTRSGFLCHECLSIKGGVGGASMARKNFQNCAREPYRCVTKTYVFFLLIEKFNDWTESANLDANPWNKIGTVALCTEFFICFAEFCFQS